MLTKDQIRQAKDRPREWLPIPDWVPEGETFDATKHGVYIGSMTGTARDRWESIVLARKGRDEVINTTNARAFLAVYSVQNEAGEALFTEDDLTWLGLKAARPLSLIFDVAMRLNRLRKEDHDELVKN